MDFRKLIDALDSFNSEAKEKVREPYTIAKAIQDINNIAVSEPSKADTKYSSANIKRFADKKTEIAYKIRELSSRIKNNDELSIYLSDLANMITGDPHNIKERPTQQHMDLIKTAILKHKEMETPKDPDSDIPYDDNADDDDEPKENLAQDLAHMKDLVKGIAKNPFKGDKVAKKINKKHGKDLAGNDLKKEGQYDGKSREELLKMKADAEASMKDMKSSGNDPQSKFYDETQMMMAQQHLDSINNALKKLGVTQESGIMYKAGVKKYGKDGMKKIQSAAGKGASAEEIGRIKDQHNKKKTKEATLDENQVPASNNVLKLVVADYKRLKAEQDDMAKQGYDEDVEMIERRLKDLRQIANLVKDGGYLAGVDTAVADNIVDYYEKAGEPLPFARESTNESPEWFQGLTNVTLNGDEFYETFGWIGIDEDAIEEAEYQGRKVKLGKPMRGDVKKFKVYVKNPKGNIVKVNFGDPDMKIKKSNPKRRKSFRARHNCDSPGPRHKARYWSCRKW